MLNQIFNNQWMLLMFAVVLIALTEAGFRAGHRLYRSKDEARKSQIGAIQAAVLGMLGLLLGFTYAMGVSRYDTRRALVLKEANAVGTAWLRAGMLPEAHRAPVKELFARYVDVRLKYQSLTRDPAMVAEGLRLCAEIESELWKYAEAATAEAPGPVTVSFFTSLNEVIDTDAERLHAVRDLIPNGIWILLLVVAGFGCFTNGYGSGAIGARSIFITVFVPILITVVIFLIFDLTHSLQGVIDVSQQPLIDLQNSIRPIP